MQAHGIPRFDASYELAGQTVSAKSSYLINLSAMAKQFALQLSAPDYTDHEHGVTAVLAACKVESYGQEVETLLREAARDVD